LASPHSDAISDQMTTPAAMIFLRLNRSAAADRAPNSV
jgi:hypothetical protein